LQVAVELLVELVEQVLRAAVVLVDIVHPCHLKVLVVEQVLNLQ
jgi:hypothetical protein